MAEKSQTKSGVILKTELFLSLTKLLFGKNQLFKREKLQKYEFFMHQKQ